MTQITSWEWFVLSSLFTSVDKPSHSKTNARITILCWDFADSVCVVSSWTSLKIILFCNSPSVKLNRWQVSEFYLQDFWHRSIYDGSQIFSPSKTACTFEKSNNNEVVVIENWIRSPSESPFFPFQWCLRIDQQTGDSSCQVLTSTSLPKCLFCAIKLCNYAGYKAYYRDWLPYAYNHSIFSADAAQSMLKIAFI